GAGLVVGGEALHVVGAGQVGDHGGLGEPVELVGADTDVAAAVALVLAAAAVPIRGGERAAADVAAGDHGEQVPGPPGPVGPPGRVGEDALDGQEGALVDEGRPGGVDDRGSAPALLAAHL